MIFAACQALFDEIHLSSDNPIIDRKDIGFCRDEARIVRAKNTDMLYTTNILGIQSR
jgi:hypothetical protein